MGNQKTCLEATALYLQTLQLVQTIIMDGGELPANAQEILFNAEHLNRLRPWESTFVYLHGECQKLTDFKALYFLDVNLNTW